VTEVISPGLVTRSANWWQELPLHALEPNQWEALCDGCGRCCLHSLEEVESGRVFITDVACRLLDVNTGQCVDYRLRQSRVPQCVQLTPDNIDQCVWLPETCAYRLRAQGLPLPQWHYLVCGDREAVQRAGIGVAGRCVSETPQRLKRLQERVVAWIEPKVLE